MVNNSSDNLLFRNCRENWPIEICIFANVCGLCSTTIWFLVLLPQILKNFQRKSVEGLSFLWATANFTASLNNSFFAFKVDSLPLYSKINAVYMPVLEAIILFQFLLYSTNSLKSKIFAAFICATFWTTIVLLQILLVIYQWLEWLSIFLWSVETFPQIFLNFKRHSAEGLSRGSVLLTVIGKTSDFFSTYLLVMPLQYVIMCYFSSSSAFFVALQVTFYWKRENLTLNSYEQLPSCEPDDFSNESPDNLISEKNAIVYNRKTKVLKVLCFMVLIIMEAVFVFGLVFNTQVLFVFVPFVLYTPIVFAYFLYNKRVRKPLQFCE